jgi:hypothetical protein
MSRLLRTAVISAVATTGYLRSRRVLTTPP